MSDKSAWNGEKESDDDLSTYLEIHQKICRSEININNKERLVKTTTKNLKVKIDSKAFQFLKNNEVPRILKIFQLKLF